MTIYRGLPNHQYDAPNGVYQTDGIGLVNITDARDAAYVLSLGAILLQDSLNTLPSFFDDFARADTSAGSLGTSASGSAWTLKGAYAGSYPLPAATDGQISSGKFVDVGGTTVYATAQLPQAQTARHLECTFSWLDDGVGTDFTTLAMIISSSSNIIDTMLHVTMTNSSLSIQKRIAGGSFINLVAPINITSPSLTLGSAKHTACVDVNGTRARVRIDQRVDVTVTDADIPSITGSYVAVEHFSNTTAVRWPMTIYSVAAGPNPTVLV